MMTFEEVIEKAEQTLQEVTKGGDSLKIALARVAVANSKKNLAAAKRATAARLGK